MTQLVLVSPRARSIKPLVEAALEHELRLLKAGLRRTEERLQEFEQKYRLSTEEFVSRYENDEFEETLDFAEWMGEYRLAKRLQEKIATLQEIEFAH
ncbi:MAG: hypothetical protein DRI61_13295 [Chloroflexi bacterium]|nr:MAG: hypothetical protein DRI61_13295 [Chloroflexota bacterium]HDN79093.1 hypothetical protein [Chloroflexota bacterium]